MNEWQPIETAPRGGFPRGSTSTLTTDPDWVDPPRILGWSKGGGLMVVHWDWYYAEGGSGYRPGCTGWVEAGEAKWADEAPTHWMHVPEPPA
jgi:hypothetical protein